METLTYNRMNNPGAPPTAEGVRSSGQDILLPPRSQERKKRSLLVEINSRDRNMGSWPSPSQFRWTFQRPLKDVQSIQLVGGTLPTGNFNLDSGFNAFSFREGITRYAVTLTPGLYTDALLASQLQTTLNALPGISNTYTVTLSPLTNQLIITRATGLTVFYLLFVSGDFKDTFDKYAVLQTINTPRKMMGFLNMDYQCNSAGVITSPCAVDTAFLLNRIYLFINQDNNQDLGTIERSAGRNNPHSILYMDMNEYPYKTFTRDTFEPLFRSSPAPISRMTTLDIALRDEFDRLINTNNRDVTLLFEITYLE